MNDPILVTGGAGSMGKLVVKRLLVLGYATRVFDLPDLNYSELRDLGNVEIFPGDITQPQAVEPAVEGVEAVIHLAALLPPTSERDRSLTFSVNVEGTRIVAEAAKAKAPGATFVLSSSVSTYGNTAKGSSPVAVTQVQNPLDIYGDSKIEAEKACRQILPDSIILRISGVSVPVFSEPPEVWPFMAGQRIEFIHRDDAVSALCSSVSEQNARGGVFNIAGGETWRMNGESYVKDYFDLLGVPIEEAQFQKTPGWCDWYDTGLSQETLSYQNTDYASYLDQIRIEVEMLMEGYE